MKMSRTCKHLMEIAKAKLIMKAYQKDWDCTRLLLIL